MPKTKQKKAISFKVTPAAATKAAKALTDIEEYLARPNIAKALAEWPNMPADVRDRALAAAPMFARLVSIARRII
jgi:hypothetical protein